MGPAGSVHDLRTAFAVRRCEATHVVQQQIEHALGHAYAAVTETHLRAAGAGSN
jgi:hypothetical protein